MIDDIRLEQLRQAAHAGDWVLAGEAYIELSLAARGSTDRFWVEAIAPYVRLRDAVGVAAVIDELRGLERQRSESGRGTK